MSLINGALQIGKTALTASQAALAVTGNNLANAATPSYSRQNVHLTPTQFMEVAPGKYTGTGVALYDIKRQVDEALNGRIRTAVGDSASYLIQQQAMTRTEAVFNELTEQDLSSRLSAFFDAWSNLRNQPQDSASRSVVLQEGSSLSNFVREMRGDLVTIKGDLNEQVRFQVSEANSLADQIAVLNEQIVVAEAGRAGSAGALRDQRDEVLKELGQMMNITTRELDGGALNVYVGNDPLIQYADSRGLKYVEEQDSNGEMVALLAFTDNDQTLSLSSGKIHGLITARDDQVGEMIGSLDDWTKALIFEVNKLHSLGQSLEGFTTTTGGNEVTDTTASLASATDTGLPWDVTNGVFYINVTNDQGETTRNVVPVQIGIDGTDTTLDDLEAAIIAIPGIRANIDIDGRMTIYTTSDNYSFSFGSPDNPNDATNVLAALGINGFFEGDGAQDMAVRSGLGVNGVAASANGLVTNGDVAGDISQLSTMSVTSLNGVSLVADFVAMVGQLAADSKMAQDNYTAADVVVQTLESERQGISGVSMDEEAIHMMTFQRAFQGAARYVSLIDELLDDVIALA